MNRIITFFKQQRVSFYLAIIADLFALVSMGLFLDCVTTSQGKFYDSQNGLIVLLTIIGLLLSLADIVLSQIPSKSSLWKGLIDGLALLSGTALLIVFIAMLFASVNEIGIYFGSNLDTSNSAVIKAVKLFIVAMVFEIVAIVLSLVRNFRCLEPKNLAN